MATARPLTPSIDFKTQIEMMHKQGLQAFNNRDLDKLVSFYAPDALVMAPSQPPAPGLNAIRQLYRQAFDLGFSNFKAEITRVVPSGELVITSGTYTIDLKTDSQIITDRGKFLSIYQLLKNGDYKVLFDIWNTDLPPFPIPMK